MHRTSTISRSHSRPRRRARERGASMVEFGLVLIPLLAVVMLMLDVAWAVFAQSTIQEAVREGVRVGVTATASGSCTTVTCTVQNTVQSYSFGFISPANASTLVQVSYYSPSGGTLTQVSGSGADVGGNIIQVTVSGITLKTLGAIMLTQKTFQVGATASDIIESNPSPGSP